MASSEYGQLVEFLGRQFTAIDQPFTALAQQFTAIGSRFDAMDRRFDAVDHQFTEPRQEMLGHFDEVYRRLAASKRGWPTRAVGAKSSSAISRS